MILQRRKISSADIVFAAGTTVTQPLKRQYLVAAYELFLSGLLTVSGGSASSAARAGERNPWGLIAQIKVIVNGGTTIWTISGKRLKEYMTAMVGLEPFNVAVSGTLAAATYPWALNLRIPLELLLADLPVPEPFASAGFKSWGELPYLPTWSFDDIELEVTWGTVADLSDEAGDRTEVISVTTTQLNEVYAATESLTAAQRQAKTFPLKVVEEKEVTLTAAEQTFEIEIPRKAGKSIFRMIVECDSDGVLVDSIINSLAIKGDSNVDIVAAQDWTQLQARNREDYAVQPTAGRAIIDFATDKNFGDILNTDDWGELAFVLDVAKPGTVDKIRVTTFALQG